jgi:hypothetical protein
VNSRVPKTRKPKVSSPKSLPGLATTVLWAQGRRGYKFGSRELKREASARTSGDQKPRNLKHRSFKILKFSKDIRTVEDLTVGSSWKKTPKTEVPKSRKFAEPSRAQKT